MLRLLCFSFSLVVLSACSLYSSAGRKQFEQNAPASTIQSFSLQGCRNMSTAETWLREEFPARNSELVEMNPDFEVWAKTLENRSMEVTVLTKHDSGEGDSPQSCTYEFASRDAWAAHKIAFLKELENSLVDLN